jgi:hypothetical protein
MGAITRILKYEWRILKIALLAVKDQVSNLFRTVLRSVVTAAVGLIFFGAIASTNLLLAIYTAAALLLFALLARLADAPSKLDQDAQNKITELETALSGKLASTEQGKALDALFTEGEELSVRPVNTADSMDAWRSDFNDWVGRVENLIRASNAGEAFLFKNIGFNYRASLHANSDSLNRYVAARKELIQKLGKLRFIVGRAYGTTVPE